MLCCEVGKRKKEIRKTKQFALARFLCNIVLVINNICPGAGRTHHHSKPLTRGVRTGWTQRLSVFGQESLRYDRLTLLHRRVHACVCVFSAMVMDNFVGSMPSPLERYSLVIPY